MRKYELLWTRIRDADPDTWIHVTVKDASMIQTIINMVQREKSNQQVTRRNLDLPQFGKLVIQRADLRVSFKLKNSGDML